jgi:hypothetical protein
MTVAILALATLGHKNPICVLHRYLSNIDCLMVCTACLDCFISTLNGSSKKQRKKAKNVALVAGT